MAKLDNFLITKASEIFSCLIIIAAAIFWLMCIRRCNCWQSILSCYFHEVWVWGNLSYRITVVCTCIDIDTHSCFFQGLSSSYQIWRNLNLPRLKSRGSQPRILTDSDSLGYPRNSYGSYICYTPTRSPSFRMLIAAFASLSCTEPHSGHIHSLTDKSFVSVFLYPQQLQS